MIPQSFLKWFRVTYGDRCDAIDVQHTYDSALTESENQELFLTEFPPTFQMREPSEEDFDAYARECERDDPEELREYAKSCFMCGSDDLLSEDGLCAQCENQGIEAEGITGQRESVEEFKLWYDAKFKRRESLKVMLAEDGEGWRFFVVIYKKRRSS